MTIESAKERLLGGGFEITDEKRLANNTGAQLCLKTGQIVNVFDKGTFNVQGKNPAPVKALLDAEGSGPAEPGTPHAAREVFIVYGHDQTARTQLEAMLRRWNLNPLILDQLASEGMTIIEKLEHYRERVGFAVVLATPDDEGFRVGHADEKALRARQNVVLELGMMLAILGRSKVAILLKDQAKMERPSDIQGLIYIPFKDDVQDAKLPLAKEMHARGINIDLGKL